VTTILDNDITIGERPYVLELQTYLRAIQRDRTGTTTVPRDGYYGADTAAGVREFQAGAGLPQTGRADRETWEAIFTAYETVRRAAQPPLLIPGLRSDLLKPGDRGDEVAFLLIMLDTLAAAYDNIAGQTADSGQATDPGYTRQTEEAIRVLQNTSGLPVTGYTDKETWNAVVRLYAQITGGRL